MADTVPLALYAKGGDVIIKGNSKIVGTGASGARVLVDGGTATVFDSTFVNMWVTEYLGTGNTLNMLGGLEVYGDAVIDNIDFANCKGPGLTLLDGSWTLGKDTIDFTGCAMEHKMAPMLIMGVTERTTKATTIDFTEWTLEGSPVGTGALIMVKDCTAPTTIKVHDNLVQDNMYAGIVVSNVGGSSASKVEVYSQTFQRCGNGLIYHTRGVNPAVPAKVNINVHDVTTRLSGDSGVSLIFENVNSNIDVKVSNCVFDEGAGQGLLIQPKDANRRLSVSLDGISAKKNGAEGVAIEASDWTGNQTFDVKNSLFQVNGGSGFSFVVTKAKARTNTTIVLDVENCTAEENSAYGILMGIGDSIVYENITLWDLTSMDNRGTGMGLALENVDGKLNLRMRDLASSENDGNGLHVTSSQANFNDILGNGVQADGEVLFEIDRCSFSKNGGNGVVEEHTFSAESAESLRPCLYYTVVGRNLTVNDNVGHGYAVMPSSNPQYAIRDATYMFYDTLFTENRQRGFYIRDDYYNYREYGYTIERYTFDNCTFKYNQYGIEQYWDSDSRDTETHVTVRDCTFKDNIEQTIYAHGYWSGFSGRSYLKSAEYDVRNCMIDGYLTLDISGATDDYGQVIPRIDVTFVDNVYIAERPMYIKLSAYESTYTNPLYVTVLYQNNTHELPSTTDGLHFEFYGGTKLTAAVTIKDLHLKGSLENGIKMIFGTLYGSSYYRKSIAARVTMENVSIENSLLNGIDFEIYHRNSIQASATGAYTLYNANLKNVENGIVTREFDGEIRRCSFIGIKTASIFTQAGIIDVYNSEVGAVTERNLQVDSVGAIRLWYEMRVKVVWETTGKPVIDANIEIKDNTWSIVGISTISGAEGVLLSNLNAYTSLADGIYTKNPYIVTVDYLGIIKEQSYYVNENMEVTIKIRDDIPPRLTIETPEDGRKQREHETSVRGKCFDLHSGIDRVIVTIDGETWFRAEGKETYRLLLTDCPEGPVVVTVRAFDTAGNYREMTVAIHIDSTPPSLTIITPEDGMHTNKRTLEVVGITDVGSRVLVNDRPIEIDYTLISHNILLNEGPNTIKIATMDTLGNINQVIRTVSLDTTAPIIEVLSPSEGAIVRTETLTIVGRTEAEDVTVRVMGREVPVGFGGVFETELTLAEGANAIAISAVDGVGNERLRTLRVTLDKTPPWIKLEQPTAGASFTDKDVSVVGYAEEGTRVFINEREVDVIFGQFETTVTTQEGNVRLSVLAVDEAGNQATITVPILVDVTAPVVEVLSPTEGYVTNEVSVMVRGIVSASETMKDLELFISKVPRLIAPDGRFDQEVFLEEGVNHVVIEVVDVAGNKATVTRTVMLDSQAPYLYMELTNVETDADTGELVSIGSLVYVTGFTEIGATLLVNGVLVEVDEETGAYNHTLELPPPAAGSKIHTATVWVSSTDAAGNTATREETVSRIEGVEVDKKEEIKSSQWAVLILSIIILAMAIAGTVTYQRHVAGEELAGEVVRSEPTSDVSIDLEGEVS